MAGEYPNETWESVEAKLNQIKDQAEKTNDHLYKIHDRLGVQDAIRFFLTIGCTAAICASIFVSALFS